jgi:hypothetical protein
VAKPVLERDCHAKVAMRRKVRGLRAIEREVVAARPAAHAGAGAVVLDYCAAVRGVLTSDQGGPLAPPGLTMAAGVRIVREGATLVPALDAHLGHPKPFTREQLLPYAHAPLPEPQRAALHRHRIMRQARSAKRRPALLTQLESRYADSS